MALTPKCRSPASATMDVPCCLRGSPPAPVFPALLLTRSSPGHPHPHRSAPGRRLPGRWRACARVTKAGQQGQLGPCHHHSRATRPHGPPLVHCLTSQPPSFRPWSPKALPGRALSLSPGSLPLSRGCERTPTCPGGSSAARRVARNPVSGPRADGQPDRSLPGHIPRSEPAARPPQVTYLHWCRCSARENVQRHRR